ncbi:unnamed protein product [Caretta caretta]
MANLTLYIDHLSNLCLECDPQFLQEIHLYLSIKRRRKRETSGIITYQRLTPEQLSEELEKEEEKMQHCRIKLILYCSGSPNVTMTSWSRS